MKLGIVSAILADSGYEEMIDCISEMGFQCVEAAAWPSGRAERRYAGVTHVDAERVLRDEIYADNLLSYAKEKGITISALAYYPNTLDSDLEKRADAINHLKNAIRASAKLGVYMVTTFIGRDSAKTVEDNLEIVRTEWPSIISIAEECGVRIAIENCPMLFDQTQWPGGQNLMTSPEIWDRVFEILKSDCLGLNFDPSHFVWQQMDYISPIYTYADKLFHVHFKDIKIYPDRLNRVGIMSYPLNYMAPKLPGLGDVCWPKFLSALTDVGYDGSACIEIEDRAFEDSKEKIYESIRLSKQYLESYVPLI